MYQLLGVMIRGPKYQTYQYQILSTSTFFQVLLDVLKNICHCNFEIANLQNN